MTIWGRSAWPRTSRVSQGQGCLNISTLLRKERSGYTQTQSLKQEQSWRQREPWMAYSYISHTEPRLSSDAPSLKCDHAITKPLVHETRYYLLKIILIWLSIVFNMNNFMRTFFFYENLLLYRRQDSSDSGCFWLTRCVVFHQQRLWHLDKTEFYHG